MLTLVFLILLGIQIPGRPAENGTIEGRLLTSAGKPAVGVRVAAMVPPENASDVFSANALSSIAETDADGRYRLEGVPPGRYYISAGNIARPTYFPGAMNVVEGRVLTVEPRAALTGVDFALKDESAGRAVSQLGMFAGPPGLSFPVSIQVEGGAKVPVFQTGIYPVLRFTNTSTKNSIEARLSRVSVQLPIPTGPNPDEYNVVLEGLQDGYAVKSISYGTADLLRETLKAQRQGLVIQQTIPFGQPPPGINPASGSAMVTTMIGVVLSKSGTAETRTGARVTGRSVGAGDEIYLSGRPGTIYVDGTFEFRDVTPGRHAIVKYLGRDITVGLVSVGAHDVDGISLQRPYLVPLDVFLRPPESITGALPESKPLSLVRIRGRVVDETSGTPLEEGAVTLIGYPNVRAAFAILGNGTFDVRDLLPGVYNLSVNVTGYKDEVKQIVVGYEDLQLNVVAQREVR